MAREAENQRHRARHLHRTGLPREKNRQPPAFIRLPRNQVNCSAHP
jgi:hypothetical protein